MDQQAFVDLLRRRNLAKVMEAFETEIEARIRRLTESNLTSAERAQRARELDEAMSSFKRTVRRRFGSFAADCTATMAIFPSIEINGAAVQMFRHALSERPSEETS